MITQLEGAEWCDLWWEQANNHDKKRVLLIGDSINRGYRPYVNQLLHHRAYVDMLATSKAIDNPSFMREIAYMIHHREDFKYEVIHINNGLHGWHLSASEYETHYNQLIRHIIDQTEPAKVIIALSTPITIAGNVAEIDPELNNKVLERNKSVERIAEEYNIAINDLYTPMYGVSDYRVADGYHYNIEGQKAQAEIVANAIKACLLNNPNFDKYRVK